jgi:hypothetical protein
VEIDTPNVAVRPLQPGRYRVEVNSDSETNVIVRDGQAEVSTPEGSTTVKAGDAITIRGADNAEYKVAEAPGSDDWDNWNKDRDRIIRDSEGVRKTNAYYTGVNDLDAYGHWVYVPGYGDVWAPYQEAAWAPYQYGRWVWEPYYGWTWVSYEPWGWAPYHYGRWFVYGGSWYWWPGPVHAAYRPVWSPAFVFFVGFGHHVNFGFGFSSIGWCPVGPFDSFYPWWGRGFNRINVVNITNVHVTNINVINRGVVVPPLGVRGRQTEFSNINMAFTNARVRSGITTVSAENFGRPGGRFERGMDVATLREARVATGNLGVVPTRESLQPSTRGLSAPPTGIRTANNNHFFSRTQPPASLPSFHEQANRVQDVVRANGGSAQMTVSRPEGGAAGRSEVSTAGRVGQQNNTVNQSGQGNAGNGRYGWHSFGNRVAQPPSAVGGMNSGSIGRDSGRTSNDRVDRPGSPGNGRTFPNQGAMNDRPPSAVNGSANSHNEAGNSSGGGRDWRQFGRQGEGNQQNRVGREGRINQAGSMQDRGGWNHPGSSGNDRVAQPPSAVDRGGYNRFPGTERSGPTPSSTRDTSYRPPLNLSKPIVVPRGSDNGGYRGMPSSPHSSSGPSGGGNYGGGYRSNGGSGGYHGNGSSGGGGRGGSSGGGGGHSSGGSGSGHSSSNNGGGGGHGRR